MVSEPKKIFIYIYNKIAILYIMRNAKLRDFMYLLLCQANNY